MSGASTLVAPKAAGASRSSAAQRQHRLYLPGRYGQLHLTITESANKATALPVICLPMSPRSGRDFDEFALALADRRRIIAPDVPGFGGSDPPPAPTSIEDYAAAILASLPHLSDRRQPLARFDVVGQHTGAAIAVAMARQAPARVRRIATIGIPLFSTEERDRLRDLYARPRPYFEDRTFVGNTWQRDVAAIDSGQPPERMLLRFTEIMRAGVRSHWGFKAVFDFDMRAALEQLPTPLLAIVLNENLGAASRAAAALVKKGEVVELSDLPGSALDFASGRLAEVCRRYFDQP